MHAFIVFALIISLEEIVGNKNVNFVKSADDNDRERQQVQHPPSAINQAYPQYERSEDRFISAATDLQSASIMPPTTPSATLHVNDKTEPEPLQLTL